MPLRGTNLSKKDKLNFCQYIIVIIFITYKEIKLKISISGIRGIVGQELSPDFIINYAQAFGSYLASNESKTVALGTDSRASADMVKHALISGLIACGISVLDLGVIPTPSILNIVKEKKLAGGVIITASHNPIEYNGLKWVSSEGKFLSSTEWQKLQDIYNKKQFNLQPYNLIAKVQSYEQANEEHIDHVLQLANIDWIQAKKFKVAYDPVNSAGSHIIYRLLEKLGCDIASINDDPNLDFGRSPEPVPENIQDLEKLVLRHNCDIGFALDPDADRLSIVSDQGIAIGEEYTLVFAIDQYLKHRPSDIAVNVSTSRMIDDVAEQHGVQVIRTAVGEINVVEAMLSQNCQIGGEGNGGVIIPEITRGRDSLCAIVMVLNAITENNCTVTELTQKIPAYFFIKDKINTEQLNLDRIYQKLPDIYANSPISYIDGIKIDFADYWLQIRESNTEPIIRIFVEAKSEDLAKQKVEEFKQFCFSIST